MGFDVRGWASAWLPCRCKGKHQPERWPLPVHSLTSSNQGVHWEGSVHRQQVAPPVQALGGPGRSEQGCSGRRGEHPATRAAPSAWRLRTRAASPAVCAGLSGRLDVRSGCSVSVQVSAAHAVHVARNRAGWQPQAGPCWPLPAGTCHQPSQACSQVCCVLALWGVGLDVGGEAVAGVVPKVHGLVDGRQPEGVGGPAAPA